VQYIILVQHINKEKKYARKPFKISYHKERKEVFMLQAMTFFLLASFVYEAMDSQNK